ncbi:MAG: peptidoglycan recognition family protein [Myxococcota bacterium]
MAEPVPEFRFQPVDGWRSLERRERASIQLLVVHRIEVSQEDSSYGDTAEEVARFFRMHPVGVQATGGAMPYPILVERGGHIVQTVPLDRVTPHARAYNATSIGLSCIGDFRWRHPEPAQYRGLVDLCAALCRALSLSSGAIKAHDELSGGSHDPDKQCPGGNLPLDVLRSDVDRCLAREVAAFDFRWTGDDAS